jgi:hypothetical protein
VALVTAPGAFDRKVAEVLDAEAGMLSEITLQLAVCEAWLDE